MAFSTPLLDSLCVREREPRRTSGAGLTGGVQVKSGVFGSRPRKLAAEDEGVCVDVSGNGLDHFSCLLLMGRLEFVKSGFIHHQEVLAIIR